MMAQRNTRCLVNGSFFPSLFIKHFPLQILMLSITVPYHLRQLSQIRLNRLRLLYLRLRVINPFLRTLVNRRDFLVLNKVVTFEIGGGLPLGHNIVLLTRLINSARYDYWLLVRHVYIDLG